jgi:rare lipoprotein A (peptidoglycan hydrolase)
MFICEIVHMEQFQLTTEVVKTNKKTMMKPKAKTETKSLGTILSEKLRERANKDSDQQREESIAEGLAIIYGGGHRHAKTANRS